MTIPSSGIPEMEYRLLGRSGLKISAIALGGWLTYGDSVENGKRATFVLPSIYTLADGINFVRDNLCMHESCL